MEPKNMAKTTVSTISRLSEDYWGKVARGNGMSRKSTAGLNTGGRRRLKKSTLTFLDLLQNLQQICDSVNWGRW